MFSRKGISPVSSDIDLVWPAPPNAPVTIFPCLFRCLKRSSKAHNTRPIPARPPNIPPSIGGRFGLVVAELLLLEAMTAEDVGVSGDEGSDVGVT